MSESHAGMPVLPPYARFIAPDEGAWRWLLAQGCDPRSIVIGGDSAGGNLTLATLHRAKAAGEPLPACAVLLSPFVDFTLSSKNLFENERCDPMFTLAGMLALRALYARSTRHRSVFSIRRCHRCSPISPACRRS